MKRVYAVIIAGNQCGDLFSNLDDAKKYLYEQMFYNSPLTREEASAWISHFRNRVFGTGTIDLYNYGAFGVRELKVQ